MHPIQVIDGAFIDTRTGEPFPVRGTNYFNIVRTDGSLQDRFFSPTVFDSDRVRADFEALADRGYTTVRLFLDSCSVGPDCISQAGVEGLDAEFLDVIAKTIHLADETEIFLVLTSNDLPDGGGYNELAHRVDPRTWSGYRNTVFLTERGAEAAVAYWRDLLTGLTERRAPLQAVLAWSIVNEMWVFPDQAPLDLRGGTVRGADGVDYDMADASQRRALVVAGFTHYLNSVAAEIREHDPHGLVTSGFFAPKFPNETSTGGEWYVDTEPLMGTVDLDFFDFHAYPGGDIDIESLAENFGMTEHPDVPVVMGEVGAFLHLFDEAETAGVALQRWVAGSCTVGFDGWLHWGYLRAPVAIGDSTWALTDADGFLLDAMAPATWPDPCTPSLADPNLARGATASASRSLAGEPASAAVDGNPGTQWGSGSDAPQWIEVKLAEPSTVGEVRLLVAQYPAGRTVHDVAVRTSGGLRTVATADGATEQGQLLTVTFAPVDDVVAVRVTTRLSPSWVSWSELDVRAG